jgi:hypothetical protein
MKHSSASHRMISRSFRFVLVLSLAANAVLVTAFLLRGNSRVPPEVQRPAARRVATHVPREQPREPIAAAARQLPSSPLVATDSADSVTAEPNAPSWPLVENLPPEKWEQLQRIAADYGELAEKIYRQSSGLIPPEDREKLGVLEREKNADLALVLTQDELEIYQQHASDTQRLQRR